MIYNKLKIEFYLNNYCNFNCFYCYNNSNTQKKIKNMDFDYFKKVIIYLNNHLIKNNLKENTVLILSGGEPTLHPNFSEIITLLNEYKFKYILITNFHNFKNFNLSNIVLSIHPQYYNYYNKNFELFKNFIFEYLNQNTKVQLQFVLDDFDTFKYFKNLKLFKDNLIELNIHDKVYINYQFLSDDLIETKWYKLSFNHIKKWENFLNPFKINSLFFDKDYNYFKNLKFYIDNNFSFKNKKCLNNNYAILPNFDTFYECGKENKKLFNIQNNIQNIKKIKIKEIICHENWCCPQTSGYCDKY